MNYCTIDAMSIFCSTLVLLYDFVRHQDEYIPLIFGKVEHLVLKKMNEYLRAKKIINIEAQGKFRHLMKREYLHYEKLQLIKL